MKLPRVERDIEWLPLGYRGALESVRGDGGGSGLFSPDEARAIDRVQRYPELYDATLFAVCRDDKRGGKENADQDALDQG